jgi:hypothetical protein
VVAEARQVTRRKDSLPNDVGKIDPDGRYRTSLCVAIFGYGPARTRQKIEAGELPMPSPLSASSRVEAWSGTQILEHRAKMEKLAVARLEAKREAERLRVEQGIKRPQPPELVGKRHIKKLKLRPPGASRKQRKASAEVSS